MNNGTVYALHFKLINSGTDRFAIVSLIQLTWRANLFLFSPIIFQRAWKFCVYVYGGSRGGVGKGKTRGNRNSPEKNYTQIFVAFRFSLAQLSRRRCRQVQPATTSNNHNNQNNNNNNACCLPEALGVKTETKTNTGQIPSVTEYMDIYVGI